MTETDQYSLIQEWMQQTFKTHYTYTVKTLTQKYSIPKADAENYLMDAIIILHEKQKEGSFESKNITGWLLTVCMNMHKKEFHNQKKTSFIPMDKMEYYIGNKKQLFTDDFNPMVLLEEQYSMKNKEIQKMDSYLYALSLLGGKCKTILNRIREGAKLRTLAHELHYTSYDSLKSTKSRCMKKLKILANQHLKETING